MSGFVKPEKISNNNSCSICGKRDLTHGKNLCEKCREKFAYGEVNPNSKKSD